MAVRIFWRQMRDGVRLVYRAKDGFEEEIALIVERYYVTPKDYVAEVPREGRLLRYGYGKNSVEKKEFAALPDAKAWVEDAVRERIFVLSREKGCDIDLLAVRPLPGHRPGACRVCGGSGKLPNRGSITGYDWCYACHGTGKEGGA